MKKLLLAVIAIVLSYPLFAYEERNLLQKKASGPEDVAKVLLPRSQWIKYPAYGDRDGWDAVLGEERKEQLIKRGESRLDYEWRAVKATDYIEFERSGDRNIMSEPLNSNIGAVTALFWAEMAEGKGRFTEALVNGIFYMCEMTSWAQSAHLVVQRTRRALPDYREHIIDLTSAGVGATFSWIYYFLHEEFDKIDPAIAVRLKHEIYEKILDPYMEREYWWMAMKFNENSSGIVNNWNPWCNSNVLLAFLLMEDDPGKLAQAVYRTMFSVDKFANYTKSDGACEEGPAYWGHAAGKMYDYLEILYTATGGAISIFGEPLVKDMGEYIARSYVGDGWYVNFADASARMDADYRLVYSYGKAVNSQPMMQFAAYQANLKPRSSLGGDTYRFMSYLNVDEEISQVKPKLEAYPYTWYPYTQFCYITEGNAFFASKGGHNDESHNHNDIGTFSLYVNYTPIFIDAGVGTYTRQTFSSERYSIWTMQSDYHNLPRINGQSQRYGRRFEAKDAAFDRRRNNFHVDIAGAYPREAGVETWVRDYKVKKKAVEITETFKIANPSVPNEIVFMSWGDIDVSRPGKVSILVNGVKAELSYDSNIFSAVKETVQLTDRRLSNVWGPEIYRIILTAKQLTPTGTYKYTVSF